MEIKPRIMSVSTQSCGWEHILKRDEYSCLQSLEQWHQLQFSSNNEDTTFEENGVLLQWRHNGRHGVPNHQRVDGLLKRLFRCRSKKTSKLRATGICAGNSPVTGDFPAQAASNAEYVSIWWRYDVVLFSYRRLSLTGGVISITTGCLHFLVYPNLDVLRWHRMSWNASYFDG